MNLVTDMMVKYLVDTVAAERPGSRGAMVREELAGALVPLAPGPEDAFLVPQAYHLRSRKQFLIVSEAVIQAPVPWLTLRPVCDGHVCHLLSRR